MFQVMGKNESRSATITIIPSTEKETATQRPPQITTPETLGSNQPSHGTDHPPPLCTTGNPYKPSGNSRNTLQQTTTPSPQPPAATQPMNSLSLQPSSTTTNHTFGTVLANARPVLPSVAKSQG